MTSTYSRVRWPRHSKGRPRASNSSASHPTPTPKMNRPPLSRSTVATVLASTKGLCSGTRQMPVANLILLVHAAAYARVANGSAIGVSVGAGNLPDEYGYLDAYSSSRTTCSGAQIVEKPNCSAVVTTVLTHSGATVGPMPTAKYPTCMISLQRSVALEARFDYRQLTAVQVSQRDWPRSTPFPGCGDAAFVQGNGLS